MPLARIFNPYLVLLLSVTLLLPSLLKGQAGYSYQQLDNSNGLSNSCLNTIYSDSDNLLWLGTWDGLNVYDGSSFHVFNYSMESPGTTIGSNVIYNLVEDDQKDVWIATIEGVSVYERQTGSFRNFFYGSLADSSGIAKGYLLASANNGRDIYATVKASTQLQYFDRKKKEFRACRFNGTQPGVIVKVVGTSDGEVWIMNNKGNVFVYRGNDGSLQEKSAVSIGASVENFFFVNGRFFVVSASNELFEVFTGAIPKKLISLPHGLRAMGYYNGTYLMAWSPKGLGEYNEQFEPTSEINAAMPFVQGMRITSISRGSQDLLWLGTDGNGMISVSPKQSQIGSVKKWPGGNAINSPIRAFNEVDGDLWVGTKGNGIIAVKDLGRPNSYATEIRLPGAGSESKSARVYSIQKGKDNYVFVGSDAQGLTVYDRLSGKWFDWSSITGSNQYDAFSSIHSILVDRDSSVWLGLESYGLIHLKLKRESGKPAIEFLHRYVHTGNNRGPANNVIYALEEGRNGELLIGCRYGGLSIFNKTHKTFQTIKASDEHGLSNNDVLSLYKDSRQRLWVGSSYGLNMIHLKDLSDAKPVFQKFTTTNGLPNNTIHGITEDAAGNIWASTNKGLVKLSGDLPDIMRLRQSDGLQSNEFSDGAVWRNDKGFLFFGGIYGFNYFLPDSLRAAQPLSNLLISGFQLAGNSPQTDLLKVVPAGGGYASPFFSSSRDANYFEMTVKSINFSSIEKCQYAYMLDGNDKEWRLTGEDGKISYNNLIPGKYKLKLKWSNGDGIWTEPVTVMSLQVRQYFWLTWPAFLIYATVLFTGWYVFYIYRKDKVEMRHRLEMEKLLRFKDEEVHKGQQQFFTNITHELQTPLTLILGGLERFIQKNTGNKNVSDKQFISLVHQQASRLSYLAQQLLEFRRAEEGFMKNQYSYFNVSNLLSNISGLFDKHEELKDIHFSTRIEQDIKLWTDKDKFEKIVFNLVSNAFKHTGSGEKVILEMQADEAGEKISVCVANSGVDLGQEDLDRIFEKFFTAGEADNNKPSTGLGLAFAKELTGRINGALDVRLVEGWIYFTLQLPLNFVPKADEMVVTGNEKNELPSNLLRAVSDNSYADGVPAADANKKAIIGSVSDDQRKSILIVDDEPALRFLLKSILGDHYIIYEAEDARKAIELLRGVVPQLIISDIMMPDMSGVEFCAIVKNTPETCHIPFMLLTARGTMEQQTEGYDAGADAYVSKPFQVSHLLVRVRKMLEYRERLHSLFEAQQTPVLEEGMREEDKEFFERLYKMIEDHLDDPALDAAMLEKGMALSKMQLYRKLKSLSQMTPNELIRHIRLQRAAHLLRTSKMTVEEIYYATGFNNRSYFFREFKKMYQSSPNDYRQQQQLPQG